MKTLIGPAFLLKVMAVALLALPAGATPISAITFTSNGVSSTGTSSTRGYSFNVTLSGLVATHLSFWDQGGDGLAEAHDIGLWDPAGVLLASTTVSSGTGATLLDGFRIVDIADIALPIGVGYTVGAVFVNGSADQQAASLVGLASAAGITYVDARFINNGIASLTQPTTVLGGNTGLTGGSFLVDAAAVAGVPEPLSIGLVALGLSALVIRRRSARTA